MEKPKPAEEIRALLLSQHPDLKNELAKISDTEVLQLMACAYKSAIDIKETELVEIDRLLDQAARALFFPCAPLISTLPPFNHSSRQQRGEVIQWDSNVPPWWAMQK